MRYKAVLFDFDYTLGDGTEAILAGFYHAFETMGLPRPDAHAVKATVGYPIEEEFFMLTGDSDPEHAAAFRKLYVEKANPLQAVTAVLLPGARELLEALQAIGVRAAVVSTKRAGIIDEILERLEARGLFTSITGGDMVSKLKPDPEGLLMAVSAMGLTPGEVLYCGDTILDAGCAQRAGADFCAVLNGTTPAEAFEPYPYVHIADDLWDLKTWLDI